MLGFVVVAYLVNIRLAVALNDWNGRFYDALQIVDVEKIYAALIDFVFLCSLIIVVLVTANYVKLRAALMVRRDLTFILFEQWLSPESTHYRLRESEHEPDNPDQRIAEDVREVVSLTLNLSLSLFNSLLTIGSFSVILWNLSGSITLFGIRIPGYMFWICLIYTALETLITHLIGRRLKRLHYESQHREADLRASLIEKRNYADAIAGIGGERAAKSELRQKFSSLLAVLVDSVKTQRNLDFFSVGVGQITHLTPVFFSLPHLLAGTIQLGGLMQIRGAFVDVARSLSWIAMSYPELAKLFAAYERLNRLQRRIFEVRVCTTGLAQKIKKGRYGIDAKISLCVPGENIGRVLDVELSVGKGEFAILSGASGTGKSTLLKTFAGFNPAFSGEIHRSEHFVWLPQKVYLFNACIKANLAYPSLKDELNDHDAVRILTLVGLGHLVPRLNEENSWQNILSGGEQQRLLLSRAILQRPQLLLVDEMTSALDRSASVEMVRIIKRELPHTAILFVTHQQELYAEADRIYSIESYYGKTR